MGEKSVPTIKMKGLMKVSGMILEGLWLVFGRSQCDLRKVSEKSQEVSSGVSLLSLEGLWNVLIGYQKDLKKCSARFQEGPFKMYMDLNLSS